MKLHLAPLVALTVMAMPLQQNSPATSVGTGLVVGRTVDGATGKPIGGVTVVLAGAPAPGVLGPPVNPTRVMTAGDGYFVFPNLAKGAFTITATKPGYVGGAYGKRSLSSGNGQPLDLTDGERRGDVTIALWKYAVIGGTVTDEAGEPLIGVQVRVFRRTIVAGRWQLSQSGTAPVTDDRGVYRAASLVPGEYVAGIVSTQATVPTALQDGYTEAVTSGNSSAFTRPIDAGGGSLTTLGGLRLGPLMLSAGLGAISSIGSASSTGAGVASVRADGALFVYPTEFYPAAAAFADASVISLASGEERSDVDFQLRPVRSVRVSGTVAGPDGPAANTGLQLLPAGSESLQSGFEAATTISDATGAFTFLGVSPGQYTINVLRTPPRPVSPTSNITSVVQVGSTTIFSASGQTTPLPIPNAPTFSGVTPVAVADRDVSGVTVSLVPGAHVSGSIEFKGTAQKPATDRLRQLFVTLDPSDGHVSGALNSFQIRQAQVDAEGKISSYQLPGGKYVVRPGALPGWIFAGATLDGKDVADAPFELASSDVTGIVVTYTDHPAELSGAVRDDARAPDAAATVLLFPADSRGWMDYGSSSRRIRNVSTSKAGTFRFSALPDGEYFVIAVHDEATLNWQDPAMLRKLSAMAARITVGEGEKKVQDLVAKPVK